MQKDDIVELTMEEWLAGNENFIGLKPVIKKFFELNSDHLIDDNIN